MNERNYFRFYFCHSFEGTILDLQMAIFGVKSMCSKWYTINTVATVVKRKGMCVIKFLQMCSQWYTINNVVTVVKRKGSNLMSHVCD